jgi:hypothetical protein
VPHLSPAYPTFHRLVAAQAVLAPLCRLDEVTFPPRLDTVSALQTLWRSRLQELRAVGWQPVQRPLDLAYAVNCPPLSFADDGTGHSPCNKYRLCPFCHGLRASLLFENILRAVRRQPRPPDLYMVVTEHTCSADDLGEALAALAGCDAFPRGGPSPWGVVWRIGVLPTECGTLLVHHAALVAVPAGAHPSQEVAERGLRVAADDLSLARTAATLASYPAGLLHERAEAALGVLDAVAGAHLGGARGSFRSALSATSVQQCRGQRVGPAGRPALPHSWLAEEEGLVSYIGPGEYPHERLAVRALVARLRLPRHVDTFAAAAALPLRLHWVGPLTLGVETLFRRPKPLLELVQPYRRHGEHGLVYFRPGRGFFVLSTLLGSRVGLQDEEAAFQRQLHGRLYVFESLGQLASRLRRVPAGSVGPISPMVAGCVSRRRSGELVQSGESGTGRKGRRLVRN